MNNANDIASETDGTGQQPNLFAIAWTMFRQLLWFIARHPGDLFSIEKLTARLEAHVCDALLKHAIALDPSLADLESTHAIRLRLLENGEIDFDMIPNQRPQLTDEQRRAWLRRYRLHLHRQRMAAMWASAMRKHLKTLYTRKYGIAWYIGWNRLHIRYFQASRVKRRNRARTHVRAHAPGRVHPLALVPP
jgi:hypothetical protein